MAKGELLTRTEEVLLTAVATLGQSGQAYGMSIFDQSRKLTKGRYISVGSIYTILERLRAKGLVESWLEENQDPAQHGTKRCFRITEAGTRAVDEVAGLSRTLGRVWNTISASGGPRRLSSEGRRSSSRHQVMETQQAGWTRWGWVKN
jgi:DNA-binding PadR family transcriptional regulator